MWRWKSAPTPSSLRFFQKVSIESARSASVSCANLQSDLILFQDCGSILLWSLGAKASDLGSTQVSVVEPDVGHSTGEILGLAKANFQRLICRQVVLRSVEGS